MVKTAEGTEWLLILKCVHHTPLTKINVAAQTEKELNRTHEI